MNKRIDELFGKALDSAVPETWTTLTPAQLAKLKNKFAELLVQDCANFLMDGLDDHFAAEQLIEHFGVDE